MVPSCETMDPDSKNKKPTTLSIIYHGNTGSVLSHLGYKILKYERN